MRAIEGKNVLLRALKDDTYIPFACAFSVEFYFDSEIIEKTTPNSGRFKEWRTGLGEWGLTLNTVTHALPSTTMFTVFDTLLEALRTNGLDIELSFSDDEGNVVTITGHVLIPHTGITSPEEGFSEDEIEMKGSGGFTMQTELANPVGGSGEPTPVEPTYSTGDTEIEVPELDGLTADDFVIERDGIGKQVITSGTPTDKQVLFTAPTTISLPYPVQEGEWILILLL